MRLNTAEAPASVPPGTALRWKAPRVGERRVSSRKPAVARPSRRTCGASRRDDGEPVSSPRLSGQGKKRCFATRGARSDRGWGKVSGVSNHFGECRDSVSSRPLALRTPGGRLHWQRFPLSLNGSRPTHDSVVWDVRAVRRRARGSISFAEVVEAHAAHETPATAARQRV